LSRLDDFRKFRAMIATDFLADIRAYARTINPSAVITCNNSLNAPDSLFSQIRSYAYNIHELAKVEDIVVVEDMATQPRVLPNGAAIEFGAVYEVLHGIARGKPIVAVTIAESDYHTPVNLTRLAMAEAAAHGSSYMLWPTWPEAVRQKMIDGVRPQAEFLREHADLLKDTRPRADVLLFLPYRQWLTTPDCRAMHLARSLGAANVPFAVVCEDDLISALGARKDRRLLAESAAVLRPEERSAVGELITADKPNWLEQLSKGASARVEGSPTLRIVVRDQPGRTIAHLLNLNVQRLSSFEDRVTPAANVRVHLRVPFIARSVLALTADNDATRGDVPFTAKPQGPGSILQIDVPRVDVSTILVIQ
jgi:hypothetical protein